MTRHEPVLVAELINVWAPRTGDQLLDATIGTGGHAAAYLRVAGTTVVGLEADLAAVAVAHQVLDSFGARARIVRGSYAFLKDSLRGGGILAPHHSSVFNHILFDLGVGSHQLSDPSRGFSFGSPGPLRMRYGETPLPPSTQPALNMLEARLGRPPDAGEIIRQLDLANLAAVLKYYGEEPRARQIADLLKRARPLPATAAGVAELIAQVLPRTGRLHPATKTFLALRLAVNRELEALAAALPQAVSLLAPHGQLAVISFHRLEDRLVKQFLRHQSDLMLITKKPIIASYPEVRQNPRARSAKLRIARASP